MGCPALRCAALPAVVHAEAAGTPFQAGGVAVGGAAVGAEGTGAAGNSEEKKRSSARAGVTKEAPETLALMTFSIRAALMAI